MKGWLIDLIDRRVTQKEVSCQKYFYSQTDKLYFWSHPLTEIYQNDLFIKLPSYTESLGFCYISSALTMFALKDNPTARLVHADIHDDGCVFRHGWVEFYYSGVWWAADYTWTKASKNPGYLKFFNHWNNPKNKWVCNHHEFWAHPTTKTLERFLLMPETSHIFGELYTYAGCQRKGGIENLGPKGSALVENPYHGMALPGKSPTYLIPDGNPLHPICRTAINDLLSGDRVTDPNLTKIEQAMRKPQTP